MITNTNRWGQLFLRARGAGHDVLATHRARKPAAESRSELPEKTGRIIELVVGHLKDLALYQSVGH